MKLARYSKLEKRNTIKSRKFDSDVIFGNYDVIAIFMIFCQFGAIGKLRSGCNA